MSGFTEIGFEKRLAELNSSQVTIQTLSLWMIYHSKHHSAIVETWCKEFLKAKEERKLSFIYLANDVVQNSKKKGPEFANSFAPILKKALDYMARNPDDKIKKSILRILKIWEERGIYEPNLIKDFESSYRKTWDDLHGTDCDVDKLLYGTPPDPRLRNVGAGIGMEVGKTWKIKTNDFSRSDSKKHARDDSCSSDDQSSEGKRKMTRKEEIELAIRQISMEATEAIEELEIDGVTQIIAKLSPSLNKYPPTEYQLLASITGLDRMPSTDAATREKISNFPTEFSNVAGVDSLCVDSDVSRELLNNIESAHEILTEYNTRLDTELEERKKVTMKLQDFIGVEKQFLTEAEQRLVEHKKYEKELSKKLEELKVHFSSMPDLSKLSSVTAGLAPLPSAGDLFSVRK